MRHDEFARYDGLGLADLVRRGQVNAAEVLEPAMSAVEASNHEINAVVCRLYDQARAAIAAGLPAGPFTGVPFLLKDLGAHYQGAVTSYGAGLFIGLAITTVIVLSPPACAPAHVRQPHDSTPRADCAARSPRRPGPFPAVCCRTAGAESSHPSVNRS